MAVAGNEPQYEVWMEVSGFEKADSPPPALVSEQVDSRGIQERSGGSFAERPEVNKEVTLSLVEGSPKEPILRPLWWEELRQISKK